MCAKRQSAQRQSRLGSKPCRLEFRVLSRGPPPLDEGRRCSMARALLTVPFVLLCSVGCHSASPRADTQADAGGASLTSAVMPSPSDEQIVASIQDAIEKSRVAEPQSGDVRSTSVGGVVTLEGHVGTASAKQRIDELA